MASLDFNEDDLQNFAIREDYAYKTALAKAYLGFREQARNLDPILEQRLFAAAVTQLDSNPARFIDPAHPGSPLQDLLQQEFMQKVLEDASVKQLMLEWLKSRFKTSLPSKVAADAASKAMAPNVTAMFHAPPTMSGAAVAATPPSLPS